MGRVLLDSLRKKAEKVGRLTLFGHMEKRFRSKPVPMRMDCLSVPPLLPYPYIKVPFPHTRCG